MRAVAAAVLLSAPALAAALEPLPDSALAKVAGRDGMSFNLSNFAMSGNAELRYYAPGGGSFGIGNLAASRSDNTDAPFADPYRLDIVAGGPGRADWINIAFPENAAGREVWQVAYDFGVNAGGVDVKNGSVILKDLIYYGDHLRVVMQVCGRDDFIVKLPNDGAARQLRIGDSVNVGWMAAACRALQ